MSLEIVAMLKCDGCGAVLASQAEHRSTHVAMVVPTLRRAAVADGWIVVNRGRYHTPTHYCRACADRPMKPVPRRSVSVDSPA